jgi:hypothetical protein
MLIELWFCSARFQEISRARSYKSVPDVEKYFLVDFISWALLHEHA